MRFGFTDVTPTTFSIDVTPTTSSISCYRCSTINRETCDMLQTVQTCDFGQVCRIVERRLAPIFGGGVTSFQRGCSPTSCTESDECKGTNGGDCIRCCDSNLCNSGGIDNLTTGNTNTFCNFYSEF